MSIKHPIVAITGSSGAGTTTTKNDLLRIFRELSLKPAVIEGDSFHRFSRLEMEAAVKKAKEEGRNISYFGSKANDFEGLEKFFREYSETGTGKIRKYLHTFDEAVPYNQMPGTFTAYEPLEEKTDILFYEGLHGGVVTDDIDVAQHVDLLIGMVPIINLEWTQKILRDTSDRGHTKEAVMTRIINGMEDYVKYITPQFSRTHINFQRVPTVDTSNPFAAQTIPTNDESFVVIRFKDAAGINFPYLLQMIDGSFMSRVNTLVVPGGKMGLAIDLILTPLIEEIAKKKRELINQVDWIDDI